MNLFLTFLCIAVMFSCQTTQESDPDCNDGSKTLRIITNAPATIYLFENQYFITEQNTIDTRLVPCSLPVQFQKDRLMVTISGEVKNYLVQDKIYACCIEKIVLTHIEER